MTQSDTPDRSPKPLYSDIPALISDIMTRITHLLRGEIDLARAEMEENIKRAAVAVGLLAGAAVVGFTALHVLAAALVAAIAEMGLAGGWAALIVGVIFLIIAVIFAQIARRDFKTVSFAPRRSIRSVRRDATTVKETTNDR